jgi:2-(1,2-epoxy-1,2-dihydrophenyl)acetyl-CoA isomerase
MKEYSNIILSKRDGIYTLTLNRPDKFNAINGEMSNELLDAIENVSQDDHARVLILTGAGSAFCTGADITWFGSVMEARKRGEKVQTDLVAWSVKFVLLCKRMPIPMIAAINGIAAGGGATIPLSFDIRIAAEDAKISMPFASRLGIVPESGSTYLLPRLIGIAKACELIFTGKTISGREAKEIGLVNDAVPSDKLQETVNHLAETIASGAPLSIRLSKRGLYQGLEMSLQSQLLWEERELNAIFDSEDHAEAMKAFFEKRKPVFRGR